MSRELAASARRDIQQARRAGVDQEFCVAAQQALEDCSNMYRRSLRGLLEVESGIRPERRAYYMAQYVFRVDAIAAVARSYAARVRAVRART